MNDPVERDDIIKAIDKRICELQSHPTFRRKNADIDLYGVKKLIINLPSARPQGEWIYHKNELSCVRWSKWECSACGERQEYKSNFCPNCGANMKGADDE